MKLNINLAKTYPSPVAMESVKDEKHYPTFYVEGEEDSGLPKEGTMVIKYKKVSENESTNDKGETRYSCTIEVHEIVSAKGDVEAPTRRHNDSEDALDALMAKKMKSKGY